MLLIRTNSIVLVLTFSWGALAQAAETAPPGLPRVNIEERVDIGLAGLNLYNTFGCIGLAAEGWKAELYDAAKVEVIMKDVSKTSNLAVQMLQRSIEKATQAPRAKYPLVVIEPGFDPHHPPPIANELPILGRATSATCG